jgi:hypothetical protein
MGKDGVDGEDQDGRGDELVGKLKITSVRIASRDVHLR